MMNDIMIYFARKLQDYCDNTNCNECPFATDPDFIVHPCKLGIPAYWDLSNTLDFPNSNKQTEDGSDPFDE